MKTLVRSSENYWLRLLLLCAIFYSVSLTTITAQERVLIEVLEEMKGTYKVQFSYDFKELENIKTTFKIVKKESFERAIKRLLDPHDLSFEKLVYDGYFLIFRKAPKKEKQQILSKEESKDSFSEEVLKNKMLSAILLDELTQAPIYDAFIFVENSSISTTTDLSGTFQLEIGELSEVVLVITHLNYETRSIQITPVDDLPTIISIKAKDINIAQIVVEAKRKKTKKRKRWEKRFRTAFIGETNNSGFVEIENPEVLWFEEKKGILKAEVADYLSITNYALGYKMRFYLDTFLLNKKNHVDYVGKVFFEDILEEMRNKESVKKNRLQTYVSSKKYFFSALWSRNIDNKGFYFGFTQFTKKGKFKHFEEKNLHTLAIKRVGEYDIITTSDYFTFADITIFQEDIRGWLGMQTEKANCFLKPLNGQLIFDKNGNIVNAHEVEELGYWTKQRIANLLPLEYNYLEFTKEIYLQEANKKE